MPGAMVVLVEDQGGYCDQTTTNSLTGGRPAIDFNVEYSDWIVEHHILYNLYNQIITEIGFKTSNFRR